MTMSTTDRRTRTERRLKIYIGGGAVYLIAAAAQLVSEWRRGDPGQPGNLLWLVGAAAFAWGIAHSLRVLALARRGDVVDPDERALLAAGRAGLGTVKVMVFVMSLVVGIQTGADGSIPLTPALLLVALLGVFFGEYVFYLRRMS
jgi:uncharacterized membrane protein